MNIKTILHVLCISGLLLNCVQAAPRPTFELKGYLTDSGAITILHSGNSADPYFAMQALLLAHDNGLDISVPAEKFANWLVSQQKLDGTFDRFCLSPSKAWIACKAADADDSLLALWMRLLETMPEQLKKNAAWTKSYATSKKALEYLYQPSRGVYMVSPVYLHGLFMDNLEVWSLKAHSKQAKPGELDKLARDIYDLFWQPANNNFLVSTQLEQQTQKTPVLSRPCGTNIPPFGRFSVASSEREGILQKLDANASRRMAQAWRDRLPMGDFGRARNKARR